MRLGLVLVCSAGVCLETGCAHAVREAKSAGSWSPSVAATVEAAPDASAQSTATRAGIADAPAPAPVPDEARASLAQAAEGAAEGAARAAPHEMLDIEAHLALLVPDLNVAVRGLRKQAVARGGTVTSDLVRDEAGSRAATIAIRVPAGASVDFLDDVDRLGEVTSRQVTATDIGREYHDSELALHNLERTLARYEEILQKAQSVEEILKIEAELSRLRGEIERLKGSLRYLADRAARSTVYVVMHERDKQVAQSRSEVAKFFPGLRAVSLTRWRGERSTVSTLGAGVAVGAGRSLNLEVDGMKHAGSTSSGLDAVLVTLGGDVYSDFLGGGQRGFLNPYLGARVGYARLAGANDLALGATLGVELWKSKYATIDADVRLFGLFGKGPAELGLQPTLGANVAF